MRVQALESLLNHSNEIKDSKSCIFCKKYGDIQTGQIDYLTFRFNSLFFADDLVKQAIFVKTGLYGCNHEKISNESIDVSNFISNAINNNNANIDNYNPSEFISLVSDFKGMDKVLDHYKISRTDKNLELISRIAKKSIRKVGREWIMSLDPDKYDIGYLFMVEKYGKGFDLPKLYYQAGYREVQKEKLGELEIGFPFNKQ